MFLRSLVDFVLGRNRQNQPVNPAANSAIPQQLFEVTPEAAVAILSHMQTSKADLSTDFLRIGYRNNSPVIDLDSLLDTANDVVIESHGVRLVYHRDIASLFPGGALLHFINKDGHSGFKFTPKQP